jgi:pilus assembly protein Flp/PilA
MSAGNGLGGWVAMMSLIRRFWVDGTAATSIEYALIAGGIAVVLVAAVTTIGTNLKIPFTTVGNAVR